jgi:hypothetical protein
MDSHIHESALSSSTTCCQSSCCCCCIGSACACVCCACAYYVCDDIWGDSKGVIGEKEGPTESAGIHHGDGGGNRGGER